MNIRRGSTVYATVLSVTGLIVAGAGGYAAYNKLAGNCGSCSADAAAAAIPTGAAEMPSCCAGHKSADEATVTTVSDEVGKEGCEKKTKCCAGDKSADEAAVKTVSDETIKEGGEGCCKGKKAACGDKAKEGCEGKSAGGCDKHTHEETTEPAAEPTAENQTETSAEPATEPAAS